MTHIRTRLLDALDESMNAKTAWLEFSVGGGHDRFDLQFFLLRQLRAGYFHYELVEADLERGWDRYVNFLFPAKSKGVVWPLPKPGNVWNGKETLTITEVDFEMVERYLKDMLTKTGGYFSVAGHGTPLSMAETEQLVRDFFAETYPAANYHYRYFTILPDFLRTEHESDASDYTLPGYFEAAGRDFVLVIVGYEGDEADTVDVLMTGGYS